MSPTVDEKDTPKLNRMPTPRMTVAVVIPCFKCKSQIAEVLQRIPRRVDRIFVVDDACPEGTGRFVKSWLPNNDHRDPANAHGSNRIQVLFHTQNQGVGGAVMTGFRAALQEGYHIVVKIDGDGQMLPELIPALTQAIEDGEADYVKGNRFYSPEDLNEMPWVRVIGNGALSFFAKLATGYWSCMDPHNGFIAVHRAALERLNFDHIEKRFFFEVDLLFQMSLQRAKVVEMPQASRYRDERSNLSVWKSLFTLPPKYLSRLARRLFYTYFLRDFHYGSLAILAGAPLLSFAIFFGGYHWYLSWAHARTASAGTVMLSALTFLVGFQFLLSALQHDVASQPQRPLQKTWRQTRLSDLGADTAKTEAERADSA
ncbi:MAG TPA: glycosyltransferase family 2 protein [Pseudobdellovibrionaceae bacterium]|mgnify:CR=1 FL=1|nr:glycosyltransferase family 2 protein [Pseudobdellovibrionaceae bacterium]